MSSASSDYDMNGDENVRGKTPPVVLESVAPEDDDPRKAIEYLSRRFAREHHFSPGFFVGSLEQAVKTALPPDSMEDVRPLLIFLNGEGSVLSNFFYQDILVNYLVWPWDVTSDTNKQRLKKWWWEIFPDLKCPDLHIEHCPMLIGIMRRAPREQTESSPFEYQFQVLQRSDLLVQTGQKSTFTNVLQTLKVFRKEWHRNEQFLLPSDISRSNFLCPDVVIEIVKYLSLPDAIHAFSIGILSMLRQEQTKIHLDNPSHRFLQMIPQHFDPRRIASLRVTDDFRSSDHNLSLLRTFDQLLHLTVVSQRKTHLINRLLGHLPNVRFVSLLLDETINCDHFVQLKQALRDHSATHLRIRCADVSCGHPRDDDSLEHYIQNTSITSCVFDFGHDPMHSRRQCRRKDPFCFFDSAMKFIETMINVRRVQFMTVRSQMEIFLQVLLWEKLISRCIHLDRVVIKVLDVGDYTQEAANIEQELRRTRPGISFLVKSG